MFGCGDKATNKNLSSVDKDVKNQAIVNALIDTQNLGVQISYIEKLFSLTAYSKGKNSFTYKIGECFISFGVDRYENISRIGIPLHDKCEIPLVFNGKSYKKSSSINFENLINETMRSGEFKIHCYLCGNAALPQLEFFFPGVHVSNWISYGYELDSTEDWYGKVHEYTDKLKVFPHHEAPVNLSIGVDSDLGKSLLNNLKQAKVVRYAIVDEAADAVENEIWESTDCVIYKNGFECTKKK